MTDRLPALLNDRPLSGSVGVLRELCVARHGALVSTEDELASAIQDACQFWGGFSGLVVPAHAWNGENLLSPWRNVAFQTDVDRWNNEAATEAPQTLGDGFPHRVPVAVVLAALDRPRDSLITVRVPRLDPDDPWFFSYLAVFGSWPEGPEASFLGLSSLRRDLRYEDLIPTEFESATGSMADLLERLQDPESAFPTAITKSHLGIDEGEIETNIFSGTQYWQSASRRALGRRFGPNLMVLYEPGNLEDACLTWCLRAGNGAQRGAPLAIPYSDSVVNELRTAHLESVFRYFGLQSSFGLTSASLQPAQLEEVRDSLGEPWHVVEPADVLRASRPPSLQSAATAHFDRGTGHISAWPDSDFDIVNRIASTWSAPPFRLRVRPHDRVLPPSPSLAADPWSSGYRAGYFAAGTPRRADIVEIKWPSGWTVVEAIARDLDLILRPSAAGKAAASLIETLGGVHEFGPIDSPSAFRLLASIASKPSRQLSIGDVVNTLGVNNSVARLWLTWAENRGLILRGAEVLCDRCGTQSWRAVADISSPVTCYGCGEEIDRPFPPDKLEFKYRLAEALVNTLRVDSLSHVLVFMWLAERFRALPGNLSVLYGMYPGVDVIRPSGELIGEVDLLAVFHDGSLAVGECKSTGKGVTADRIAKLDELSEELSAEWAFIATPAPRDECPDIWQQSLRELPDRPLYGFAGEMLFGSAIQTMSFDPFDWENDKRPTLTDVDERYRKSLSDTIQWLLGQSDPDRELRDAWRRRR